MMRENLNPRKPLQGNGMAAIPKIPGKSLSSKAGVAKPLPGGKKVAAKRYFQVPFEFF